MSMINVGVLESEVGKVHVAVRGGLVVAVSIGRSDEQFRAMLPPSDEEIGQDKVMVAPFLDEMARYLAGELRDFTHSVGHIDWGVLNPFQADVLRHVCVIPYGETQTYGQIAAAMGKAAGASRAVGRANATNPIPIIIPCHRVIGSDGKLRGYNAPNGIGTKAWLLKLEGGMPPVQAKLPF